MTRQEILALDDERLVREVAHHLFGYDRTKSVPPMVYDLLSQAARGVPPDRQEQWCPLYCWDHCWLVVEAMRAKGWCLEICPRTNDGRIIVKFVRNDGDGWGAQIGDYCDYGNEKPTIMMLALGALAES